MPKKPPTFRAPGQNVWDGNEAARKAALDRTRPSAQERGYDAAWRKVRNQFKAAHPMCCVPGCGCATEEVDHVLSVRDRPDLRLRWQNLRPLCRSHHSARTAGEQGFGRRG